MRSDPSYSVGIVASSLCEIVELSHLCDPALTLTTSSSRLIGTDERSLRTPIHLCKNEAELQAAFEFLLGGIFKLLCFSQFRIGRSEDSFNFA